jgi:broad specificity phosphatase PhoE
MASRKSIARSRLRRNWTKQRPRLIRPKARGPCRLDARSGGGSPWGESILSLIERVGAWLEAQSAVPGKTVAITHASVIRAVVVYATGAPPQSFWRIDIAPLSITSLSGTEDRWNLVSANCTPSNDNAQND